uniref:Uncharacterized protein n=1 Tax=Cacopsylla melanoneura TaxID=428564 RepID=A0A8D8Q5D9_9HEMI
MKCFMISFIVVLNAVSRAFFLSCVSCFRPRKNNRRYRKNSDTSDCSSVRSSAADDNSPDSPARSTRDDLKSTTLRSPEDLESSADEEECPCNSSSKVVAEAAVNPSSSSIYRRTKELRKISEESSESTCRSSPEPNSSPRNTPKEVNSLNTGSTKDLITDCLKDRQKPPKDSVSTTQSLEDLESSPSITPKELKTATTQDPSTKCLKEPQKPLKDSDSANQSPDDLESSKDCPTPSTEDRKRTSEEFLTTNSSKKPRKSSFLDDPSVTIPVSADSHPVKDCVESNSTSAVNSKDCCIQKVIAEVEISPR